MPSKAHTHQPPMDPRRSGGLRRPDVAPTAVALRRLAGLSLVALSLEFRTSIDTIKRRLEAARGEFPELLPAHTPRRKKA